MLTGKLCIFEIELIQPKRLRIFIQSFICFNNLIIIGQITSGLGGGFIFLLRDIILYKLNI